MVTSRQLTISSTRRDAWVEVDLSAIEHNIKMILSWLGHEEESARQNAGFQSAEKASKTSRRPKLMAVVKSDAYGHGAVGVAEVLISSGAEWLGVASVDEGFQLREVDGKIPILLLSPAPTWAIRTAIEHDLDLTVTSISQVAEIAAVAGRAHRRARVNLKVDTGMHRLGIAPESVDQIIEEIRKSNHLQLVSVFSHLAIADNESACTKQNVIFEKIVQSIRAKIPDLMQSGHVDKEESILFHLASGDAARRFPNLHYDMVRVGLLMYGLEARQASEAMQPAMSIRGRINHVREIESGESAGYNWIWTAQRPTRLASIPIGYADGIDRGLSNRMSAILMGSWIRQVGTMSMDQMLFDITDVPDAEEGDVITLVGKDGDKSIELAQWAQMLDTITYELACRMRVRLPRIYTRHRPAAGA